MNRRATGLLLNYLSNVAQAKQWEVEIKENKKKKGGKKIPYRHDEVRWEIRAIPKRSMGAAS